MSKDTNTNPLTVDVPVYTEGMHVTTQYGCRFPNGDIEWAVWKDYAGTQWGFDNVVKRSNPSSVERWGTTLKRRADAANIPLDEYAEAHTFVKRTVILGTTAPEDVTA